MSARARSLAVSLALLGSATFALSGCGAPESDTTVSEAESLHLPGGHKNYVFALGHLVASQHDNWVWIGSYTFLANGRVTSSHWRWGQDTRVDRDWTGRDSCLAAEGYACPVRGPHEFASRAPIDNSGTYSVSGNLLTIHWANGKHQAWMIQPTRAGSGSMGRVTRLEYVPGDNIGIDYGWAYGSNASLTARTSIAALARDNLAYRYAWKLWKAHGTTTGHIDSSSSHTFALGEQLGGWTPCPNRSTSECLAKVSHTSACARSDDRWNLAVVQPAGTRDRRDVREYWCKANATAIGEVCYTGNSHVDAMLQIIDDDEKFLGWVGVEASIGQSPSADTWPHDQIGLIDIKAPDLLF